MGTPIKDYTGQKYNSLTFVRPTDQRIGGKIAWELMCDCGTVIVRVPHGVKKGSPKSCGCKRYGIAHNRKDYTGQTHYQLTFIRPMPYDKEREKLKWEAICSCGKLTYICPSNVINGHNRSCGCLHAERIQQNKLVGNATRKHTPIISSARDVWHATYCKEKDDISFDDFYRLSQLPCDYCGRNPFTTFNKHKGRASLLQREHGHFTYNGLDRVDSSKGHTLDNVVPCCPPCNWAKSDMTRQEFLAHIERIHLHQQGKNTPTH
jgi:hypothetical protein